MFGLAQLYQIRGRVGRSNRRAYAYFIIPAHLSDEARIRLETLVEYESLGSGYQIAMRDMELRGAGTLLGTKQSGVIHSIGFNYYNRLLEKAIKNIQNNKPKNEWIEDEKISKEKISIEVDNYFSKEYISNEKQRLEIYRKMLSFTSNREFEELTAELKDRFGKIPRHAQNAIFYYKLKMLVDKTDLTLFKIKKPNIVLEFDEKRLPARDKLSRIIKHFDYPVSFSTTQNFLIIFKVLGDKISVIKVGIKILEFMIENF